MPEFLKLTPVYQALQILLKQLQVSVKSECITTINALGRVTAESIYTPIPSHHSTLTVDGYAVRAEDTFGRLRAYRVPKGKAKS
jgi:molybdopterin biosynthesis enzyme